MDESTNCLSVWTFLAMTQAHDECVRYTHNNIKKKINNCESDTDKWTERHLRFLSSVTDPLYVRYIFPPIDIYSKAKMTQKKKERRKKSGKKFEKNNNSKNSVASSKAEPKVQQCQMNGKL